MERVLLGTKNSYSKCSPMGTRHISGEGYKTMSRVLNFSKSTAVAIIGKWNTFSPTDLSNRARRTLVREVTNDHSVVLSEFLG